MRLTNKERKVREILIKIAQGKIRTHRPGFISYSELWRQVSDKPWGRGCKTPIVNWISKITSYELSHGRPPLNELVVKKGTDRPGYPWRNIKKYHKEMLDLEIPYSSHEEAQEECWQYWQLTKQQQTSATKDDTQAEEGYRQDRSFAFRKRNSRLIQACKRRDNYECQACGFRQKVNGLYIIDCHHTNPLGLTDSVRVTRLSQLVCLCPTCHRIAHTRTPPLTVKEIKALSR